MSTIVFLMVFRFAFLFFPPSARVFEMLTFREGVINMGALSLRLAVQKKFQCFS